MSENNLFVVLNIFIPILLIYGLFLANEINRIRIRNFTQLVITTIFCLFIKNAVADDIIMQKHSYSEEYEISEKHDSIRKLEQYIKYREIELNDLKSEIKTEKEKIIIEALEEKAKDISQNIQFSKYALEQLKLGKKATIEYKQ